MLYNDTTKPTLCLCNKKAVGYVKVVSHSPIYAGLREVENTIENKGVCQYHFDKAQDLIKTQPDILEIIKY
jgi:hypothetical protein